MIYYTNTNTGSETKSGLITSLENQFVPVISIDPKLSLVDFDENGIIGLNHEHIYIARSSSYYNKVYRNGNFIKSADSHFMYPTTSSGYISISVYKSDDVIKIYENIIEVFYQNYPILKELIKEIPETKRNVIHDFSREILINLNSIKRYKLSTNRYVSSGSRNSTIRVSHERCKSLCFSKIEATLGINTISEFLDSL